MITIALTLLSWFPISELANRTMSAHAGMMPCSSSSLVDRLIDAHGVVLGKTRMHELAEGVTSINAHGGPVLNPYNNRMHVGGLDHATLDMLSLSKRTHACM